MQKILTGKSRSNASLAFKIMCETVRINAASIEDKETSLVAKNTMKKKPKAIKNAIGDNARITPAPVATPLPPLNKRYMGNI